MESAGIWGLTCLQYSLCLKPDLIKVSINLFPARELQKFRRLLCVASKCCEDFSGRNLCSIPTSGRLSPIYFSPGVKNKIENVLKSPGILDGCGAASRAWYIYTISCLHIPCKGKNVLGNSMCRNAWRTAKLPVKIIINEMMAWGFRNIWCCIFSLF